MGGAAVIKNLLKIAEGKCDLEVVSAIEDMKVSSGVPEIEAAVFHQFTSVRVDIFKAGTRACSTEPTLFTGRVGGSHRAVCKSCTHHFLLLVLI